MLECKAKPKKSPKKRTGSSDYPVGRDGPELRRPARPTWSPTPQGQWVWEPYFR